ncbi:PepSY domain-containing protein [Planococcus dechangensis]|uniref:PepSY domain-containing protein n=1 Tax=Planococcus dechangensis TaxID=1176255 RepID=A0ABV9MA37_9BACL
MKKLIYIPAAAILAFGGIVLADTGDSPESSQAAPESTVKAAPQNELQRFISFEEAKEIAKTKAQGNAVELKLSGDDEDPHYSVEVKKKETVDQFRIDAKDGAIRNGELQPEAANNKIQPQQHRGTVSKSQLIGKQQAVAIARTVASGKVDDIELEKEHGMFIYEVEFEDGDTDYEVYVDAINGTVHHVETDFDD